MAQSLTRKNHHRMEAVKKQVSFNLTPNQLEKENSQESERSGAGGESTQLLSEFAMTKGHTIHTVTHMPPLQLAEFLRDFYSKVRPKLDESSTDLKDVRQGLHKYFMQKTGVDIVRDKAFESANATFDFNSVRMAPRKYKCHRQRIETEHLHKIYLSDALSLDFPETLQNKVFFDVTLYITNRGKDCLRVMVKSDFEVSTDPNGLRYVWLKYHPKFSSREIGTSPADLNPSPGNQLGGRMYERPGDPRCPVRSFLKYMQHLHPMKDAFWQRPKRSVLPSDYVWFDNTCLGNSTLSKIMQRIAQQAGITENYTNYSIRSSYIPLIEELCQETLNSDLAPRIPPPPNPMTRAMEDGSGGDEGSLGDNSSVSSDSKDTEVDDSTVGLRDAKQKVLGLIQGLMVKDIQKFCDWLRTVKVEVKSGELMVVCSPVNKDDIPSEDPILQNGHSQYKGDNPLPPNGLHRNTDSPPQKMPCVRGISIKPVDFQSAGGIQVSTGDLDPVKVTVPASDTVLVSGITNNVQVLLHRKTGGGVCSAEALSERVFASENDMDVSEVAAVLSACTPPLAPIPVVPTPQLTPMGSPEREETESKLQRALKRMGDHAADYENCEPRAKRLYASHKSATSTKQVATPPPPPVTVSPPVVVNGGLPKAPPSSTPPQPYLTNGSCPLLKKRRDRFGIPQRTFIKTEPVEG